MEPKAQRRPVLLAATCIGCVGALLLAVSALQHEGSHSLADQHFVQLGSNPHHKWTGLPRRVLHAAALRSGAAAAGGPLHPYPILVAVGGVAVAIAAMTAMMGMCGCCGGETKDKLPENLKIAWSDIQINEQIGQGGFGQVFKGMWQGNRVAVKVLNPDRVSPEMRTSLCQEALMMSQLMHPCIARVFGLVDDGEHLALVMQYYRRGTLEEFMTRPGTRPLYQEWDMMRRLHIALMVARGMQFLHERRILHGDLKTSNLLMDETDRVYITDFGLARALNNTMKRQASGNAATSDYRLSVHISPPEVLGNPGAPRTPAADVYAFGVVLLEVVSGQPPFKGMNANMIQAVVMQGKRPGIPQDIPQSVQSIITMCWNQDPHARPNFQDVINMLNAAMQEIRASSGLAIPDDTRFY